MTGQWKPQAHINACEKQPVQSTTVLWWEFRLLDKMSCGSLGWLRVPVLPQSTLRPAPFSSLSLATLQSCNCCAQGRSIPPPPVAGGGVVCVSNSIWGRSKGEHGGMVAWHTPGCLPLQLAASSWCQLCCGTHLLHPTSVKCGLQVFSVSELRFLMLWNIYTISY